MLMVNFQGIGGKVAETLQQCWSSNMMRRRRRLTEKLSVILEYLEQSNMNSEVKVKSKIYLSGVIGTCG